MYVSMYVCMYVCMYEWMYSYRAIVYEHMAIVIYM